MRRLHVILVLILLLAGGSGAPLSANQAASERAAMGRSAVIHPKFDSNIIGDQVCEQQFDKIWDLVRQNFLYEERLKGWDDWRLRYCGRLHSVKDIEGAANAMLDSLMDEYTFFRNSELTGARHMEAREKNVVSSRALRGGTGYIKIRTFSSKSCVGETRRALERLSSCRAYVLDLRDNWGGCIDDAYQVFEMFCSSGSFVKMVGREDDTLYTEELSLSSSRAIKRKNGLVSLSSRLPNMTGEKPLVVLVNDGTKSAAEMVAGALKLNGRAALVGVTTYGKGVVQQVWDFDNGTSVKITSARFFLPGGVAIHGQGIKPDFLVRTNGARDYQLKAALMRLARIDRGHRQAEARMSIEGSLVSRR